MNAKLKDELSGLLFPDGYRCIVCDREIEPNRYGTCDKCKIFPNDNYCLRCGRHKVGIGDYCHECADEVLYFDEARSAVDYVGEARSLVRRLKYGAAPYLAKPLSSYLLDVLLFTDWEFDCFTYVPMHVKRQKKRGYNQAKLLAQQLALRTDKECIDLLEKTVATGNQARLNRAERLSNLSNTFETITTPPEHVVLIDDVMTTGATVNECSRMLKKAGAKIVYVLTFASVGERPALDKNTVNIKDFKR